MNDGKSNKGNISAKRKKERIKVISFRNKKTILQKVSKLSTTIILILKLTLFLQMFINIKANEDQINLFESHDSYITLKFIKKITSQTFLGNNFTQCPDEIYINEVKYLGGNCKTVSLPKANSLIKLVWTTNIKKNRLYVLWFD